MRRDADVLHRRQADPEPAGRAARRGPARDATGGAAPDDDAARGGAVLPAAARPRGHGAVARTPQRGAPARGAVEVLPRVPHRLRAPVPSAAGAQQVHLRPADLRAPRHLLLLHREARHDRRGGRGTGADPLHRHGDDRRGARPRRRHPEPGAELRQQRHRQADQRVRAPARPGAGRRGAGRVDAGQPQHDAPGAAGGHPRLRERLRRQPRVAAGGRALPPPVPAGDGERVRRPRHDPPGGGGGRRRVDRRQAAGARRLHDRRAGHRRVLPRALRAVAAADVRRPRRAAAARRRSLARGHRRGSRVRC